MIKPEANNVSPTEDHKTTLERSLKGGHWFLLDSLFQKVIILGAFFVTARLLTPQDFGIIALAAIYPNLVDSLTAIGFDSALSQKKLGEEKPFLDAVWTFNILRTIIVFIIVLFSAPFVVRFFHTPEALLLFQLSAIPLLFQSLSNIGQLYFFRHLDIKKVFMRDIFNYGTAAVITVSVAWYSHSYWAIFIGNSAGILAAALSTYVLSNYRPRFNLYLKRLQPLLSYSEWVFGQGIITRLAQTLEDSLVGHFTNSISVGLYSKAKSLAYAPLSPVSNIIGKIGFSAIVAVQDSLAHVREGFYKSFDVAVAVALPFNVLIWIAGERIIFIFLGSSWSEITPLLVMLVAVATLNTTIINLGTMVMNALNKPNYVFYVNALTLFCAVIFLPPLVLLKNIQGAAIALLVIAVIVSVYALFLVNKTLRIDWGRLCGSAGITILASFLALILSPYLLKTSFGESIFGFFSSLILLGIVYSSVIVFFGKTVNKGPYKTLMLVIRSFKKR